MDTSVVRSTTVSSSDDTLFTLERFSFPITVDFVAPVANSTFGFTVATTQNYQNSRLVLHNGEVADFTSVRNTASASDVSPASSSQRYTSTGLKGPAYSCEVDSANNVLTSVSHGCK